MKRAMKCSLIVLCACVSLMPAGCESPGNHHQRVSLQERLLPHPNPTSYEFDVTVSEAKDAIGKAFDEWRHTQTTEYHRKRWEGSGDVKTDRGLSLALRSSGLVHLLWKGDGDVLANNLLLEPGNENDAYIYGGGSPIGRSRTYFKNGQPLIYYADYQIHLTATGPKKTRIEILSHGSRVITGLDKSWSPHGPSFIFVEVPPTTIEEYQFLLGIGDQLGVKDLPPLSIPEPNASVRQITKQRRR